MPIPTDIEGLTVMFQRLGAENPEAWAQSQHRGGINQLHRFLFLRQAWSRIIPEGEDAWIDKTMDRAKRSPNEPYAGAGQALRRVLDKGANRKDLVDIVCGMQATLLFDLCYLLDDPGFQEPELSDLGCCLVATDQQLNPTDQVISGLHESVLGTDPTGREMRPRNAF
jgi:hypothetical protein